MRAPAPHLVVLNRALAVDLGLEPDLLTASPHNGLFSGSWLPNEVRPLAQRYAGHQFGHFTILGDGRAMLLGEHLCPDGRRVDIHLKGAGTTPCTRRGDGRATLGPMLREFLISEAMHALGIPTTRSLAVAMTGESCFRHGMEPGAMLTRVASSHLRVGTFQFAAVQGDPALLGTLVQYAFSRHVECAQTATEDRSASSAALRLLQHCVASQAELIAAWMLVGFIHGVMNTDNMAISGETIDYGPCAWMNTYEPTTVFSSIDHHGRYAYANQPEIALWNLTRLAESLLPVLADDRDEAMRLAEVTLNEFPARYAKAWSAGMRAKLGLEEAVAGDSDLVESLLETMREEQLDYTNTFRTLPEMEVHDASPKLARWLLRWHQRLGIEGKTPQQAKLRMAACNPAVIARNHLVESALGDAVAGDFAKFHRLLEVLSQPYQMPTDPTFCEPSGPEYDRHYQTFCGT